MGMENTTRRKWKLGIGLAASVVLAGCGGGGGGGGSSSGSGGSSGGSGLSALYPSNAGNVTIDSSNEQQVAKATGNGARSLGDSGASLTQSQIVGAAEIDGGAATASPSIGALSNIAFLQALKAIEQPTSVTGVVSAKSCPGGGSISVTGTGAKDGTLDAGDSFQATFDSCSVTTSGFTVFFDGAVNFSVSSRHGDPTAFSRGWDYQVDVTYNDWVVQFSGSGPSVDILVDGELKLSAVYSGTTDELTYTIKGGPWAFKDRSSDKGWGYGSLDVTYSLANASNGSGRHYTLTVSGMSIASSGLNGKVTVQTTTDFEGTEGNPPTVGIVQINDGSGHQVVIDASGGTKGCTPGTAFELTRVNSSKTCVSWQ